MRNQGKLDDFCPNPGRMYRNPSPKYDYPENVRNYVKAPMANARFPVHAYTARCDRPVTRRVVDETVIGLWRRWSRAPYTHSRCVRSCTFPWRICCRSSGSPWPHRNRKSDCNRSGTRTCTCGSATSSSTCWSSSACGWCRSSCRWPEPRRPTPTRPPSLTTDS